ncbi:MAG: SDR family oxidoreductase [Bradyrhizobium sp.]|nr:MAG: SDR family oxidoreductase [Bradyrhizobium sp.]
MSERKSSVIVGGSSGIGLALAKALAARGERVVVTSRDATRAEAAARQIGGDTIGLAFDLAEPQTIAAKLASVGSVDHLAIPAIERDRNSVKNYDVAGAMRLVTIKLVGYVEVIHALLPRFTPNASVVLFGGQARERPYPGSTTVTAINGAVTTMVRNLAYELTAIRFNAIHPGVVADTPAWSGNAAVIERTISQTPGGRLVTTADCVAATLFLLDNQSMNGANLVIDSAWGLT